MYVIIFKNEGAIRVESCYQTALNYAEYMNSCTNSDDYSVIWDDTINESDF